MPRMLNGNEHWRDENVASSLKRPPARVPRMIAAGGGGPVGAPVALRPGTDGRRGLHALRDLAPREVRTCVVPNPATKVHPGLKVTHFFCALRGGLLLGH